MIMVFGSMGQDVASKIMALSLNGPRAVCVLSANGSISNVTLRQQTTFGGTVTHEVSINQSINIGFANLFFVSNLLLLTLKTRGDLRFCLCRARFNKWRIMVTEAGQVV